MARNQDTKIALTHPLLKGETMKLVNEDMENVRFLTLCQVENWINKRLVEINVHTHPDNYHDMLVRSAELERLLDMIKEAK